MNRTIYVFLTVFLAIVLTSWMLSGASSGLLGIRMVFFPVSALALHILWRISHDDDLEQSSGPGVSPGLVVGVAYILMIASGAVIYFSNDANSGFADLSFSQKVLYVCVEGSSYLTAIYVFVQIWMCASRWTTAKSARA